MLLSLTIENLALVEHVNLTFEPGLSVLTGETGAGKSVIVSALSLALGGRTDRQLVRHGTRSSKVSAVFQTSAVTGRWPATLVNPISNGQLRTERRLGADGTSLLTINGEKTSLTVWRSASGELCEILSQHAGQRLLQEEYHLDFLDSFGSLTSLRQQVALDYQRWQQVKTALARTLAKRDQLVQERELLSFQRQEIERANIRPGEEEEVTQELRRLNAARALMTSATVIGELLENDQSGLLSQLGQLCTELDAMANSDPSLCDRLEEVSDIRYRLEDIQRFIEQYGASIEDNPQRVEEINLRLDEIYRLKKKYGGSEESVLKSLQSIQNRLSERPDTEELIGQLQDETDLLGSEYLRHATDLSEQRHSAGDRLRKLVRHKLRQLAINENDFRFEFLYEDDVNGVPLGDRTVTPYEHGLECARILFTANPGEPLRPLARAASGGEISRVLLALKGAEMESSRATGMLLVFDEVDAGIGGQTASAVAESLKQLSHKNQVLVITHLHQIARLADHHYVVDKDPAPDGRVRIKVRKLPADQIPDEIDRMIALPVE
ncbi:MAG: DNA repair protein RecN [Candidatus Zixiibacteriota bacterium]